MKIKYGVRQLKKWIRVWTRVRLHFRPTFPTKQPITFHSRVLALSFLLSSPAHLPCS